MHQQTINQALKGASHVSFVGHMGHAFKVWASHSAKIPRSLAEILEDIGGFGDGKARLKGRTHCGPVRTFSYRFNLYDFDVLITDY